MGKIQSRHHRGPTKRFPGAGRRERNRGRQFLELRPGFAECSCREKWCGRGNETGSGRGHAGPTFSARGRHLRRGRGAPEVSDGYSRRHVTLYVFEALMGAAGAVRRAPFDEQLRRKSAMAARRHLSEMPRPRRSPTRSAHSASTLISASVAPGVSCRGARRSISRAHSSRLELDVAGPRRRSLRGREGPSFGSGRREGGRLARSGGGRRRFAVGTRGAGGPPFRVSSWAVRESA